jgi:hypothetical protein
VNFKLENDFKMLSKIRRFCSLNVTVGVGQQRPINRQQFITMLIKLSLVRMISHFELHRKVIWDLKLGKNEEVGRTPAKPLSLTRSSS